MWKTLSIESRAPQTSQTQTPTTTSFFGIGSIPEFGTVTSFSKLFPVSGAACTTASGDEGTCLTQSDCDNQAGTKDGNCGTVFLASAGVCCQCNKHFFFFLSIWIYVILFLCLVNIRKCSDTAIRSPVTWSPPARAFSKVSCTLTFPANPGLTVAGTTIGGGLTSSSNSIRSCQLKWVYYYCKNENKKRLCKRFHFISGLNSSTSAWVDLIRRQRLVRMTILPSLETLSRRPSFVAIPTLIRRVFFISFLGGLNW